MMLFTGIFYDVQIWRRNRKYLKFEGIPEHVETSSQQDETSI